MIVGGMLVKETYRDSVFLMRLSDLVREVRGVRQASVFTGTEANKRILNETGLLTGELAEAKPHDIMIAVEADEQESLRAAMSEARRLLAEGIGRKSEARTHRTLESAVWAMPNANLALISVPGEYAASEARKALMSGLNVFLFSDNVSLDDEVSLKAFAESRGLLVMGPDCGTSLMGGKALGFGNVVRRGPVGIVGASGTGIQEISSLLDRLCVGVSHAIGTGSRDLHSAVGGTSTIRAIRWLADDEDTRVILIVSKPPAPEVVSKVIGVLTESGKPGIVCFLGLEENDSAHDGGPVFSRTLEEAAMAAARAAGNNIEGGTGSDERVASIADGERRLLATCQKYIRGLFSGGTLCQEAMLIAGDRVSPVFSNSPVYHARRLDDALKSVGHAFVDLGDDEFTQGRAHPMIDPEIRRNRIVQEAADPETAVIMLDIVIGYGSHADPAGALAKAIKEAKSLAAREGRHLSVVASVTGTIGDPQGLTAQEATLRGVGAIVANSNAQAARIASLIVSVPREEEAI